MSSSRVHTSLTGALPSIAFDDVHGLGDDSRTSASRAGRSRRRREHRVDLHLLGLEPRDLRATPPGRRSGTACRSRPRSAVGVDFDDAVQRLHRRVREVRELVLGLEHLRGARERRRRRRRLRAATRPASPPAPGTPRAARRSERARGRVRPSRPRARRVPASPPRSRSATTATPLGIWTTSTHAGHRLRLRRVERLHRRAEARRVRDDRGQHARAASRRCRTPRCRSIFARAVERGASLADELEVLRVLELRRPPAPAASPPPVGELAERRLAAARVRDDAVLDAALGRRARSTRAAAAATSIARAAAPALRICSNEFADRRRAAGHLRGPRTRLLRRPASAGAPRRGPSSSRASSSSATSIGEAGHDALAHLEVLER